MTRTAALLAAAAFAAAAGAAPLPTTDPFIPGTRWVGTLSQKGTFGGGAVGPPAFRTRLTVTARDGERFEGELFEEAEGVRVTYVVKGTVAPAAGGYAVHFRSAAARSAENTVPVLNVPYSAVLTGRQVRGTWRVPQNGNGVNIEGDFALELSK